MKKHFCCDSVEKCKRFRELSFEKAVELAFFKENKKIRSHQRWIPRYSLINFTNIMLAKKEIFMACNSFDDIYKEVKCERIKFIGELSIYDMALAIGMFRELLPDKVYLHRGTRVGAEKLLNINSLKNREFLEISELPEWLQNTPPYIIEDFLCICKKKDLSETTLKEFLK